MHYVIQHPDGDFLHKEMHRERPVADHGYIHTYGPFWTKELSEAMSFETWFQAEAKAGYLFFERCQRDITFQYMDTIKEIS